MHRPTHAPHPTTPTRQPPKQLSELPEAFIIEVEIQAKEVAKEDALSLHVHSLADLKRQCPRCVPALWLGVGGRCAWAWID